MKLFKKKKEENLVEPIARLADENMAKAWDEGFETARMIMSDDFGWEFYSVETFKNPYRKDKK